MSACEGSCDAPRAVTRAVVHVDTTGLGRHLGPWRRMRRLRLRLRRLLRLDRLALSPQPLVRASVRRGSASFARVDEHLAGYLRVRFEGVAQPPERLAERP